MWHVFKYKFLILMKNKSMIFWTLIFPIVMSSLFWVAFSNLEGSEQFSPVKIAVVESESFENNEGFKTLISELSKEGENKVFDTQYVTSKEAKELMEKDKVAGYITVDDEILIYVKNKGIEQTIIKSIVDNYYQISSVVGNIILLKPEKLNEGVLDNIKSNKDYTFSSFGTDSDTTIVYYFTLIGMVCLYGSMFGINAINETESNLSKRAARTSVAPTSKIKVLLISLTVSFLVQYSEMLILLGYLNYILKINMSGQLIPILILAFMGSLAGITLGVVIGVSNKKSENTKIGIMIAVTMALSFLSGLMIQNIRYIINEKAHIISKINPVNMITDGFYSIYYYDNLDRYFYNIISLVIFSFIMILISYFFLRRKKYDSI